MSFALTQKLIRTPLNIPANEKLLLNVIADMIGESNTCWPSHKTLSERVGVSIRTSKRLVKSLKDRHILLVQKRFNDSNLYTIDFEGVSRCHPPSDRSGKNLTSFGTLIDNRIYNGIYNYLSDKKQVTSQPPIEIEIEIGEENMGSIKDIQNDLKSNKPIGNLKPVNNPSIQLVWKKEVVQWKVENEMTNTGQNDLTGKQIGQLKHCQKKCLSFDPIKVTKYIIRNWDEFTTYVKDKGVTKGKSPSIPMTGYYLEHINLALDFYAGCRSDINIKSGNVKIKTKINIPAPADPIKPLNPTQVMVAKLKAKGKK